MVIASAVTTMHFEDLTAPRLSDRFCLSLAKRGVYWAFSRVASRVMAPPELTLSVRCQVLKRFLLSATVWIPRGTFMVEGVLPTNCVSRVMSAPEGSDFTLTSEGVLSSGSG